MRPKELMHLLSILIPAGKTVLIKGAPGTGKSDIVDASCREVKADLMIKHPSIEDPTDPKGLPCVVDGKAVFLPYGDMMRMMTAKKRLVVFLDDLGQAPACVQAAYMQLLLARQIGGKKISDHVTFIAATNRKEDRAGVTNILEPVKSRFATIVELTPNADDWCEWAADHNVPTELIAYIRFRPQSLMATGTPTNDIVNRACPRTVYNLGELWNLGIQDHESLAGAAGEGFATEFLGFVRLWRSLPSIDGILLNPKTTAVPSDPAALAAVSVALADRATEDSSSRVMQYLARLPEEYTALGIKHAQRRCPEIANCREFIMWASSHQDILV